MADELNLSDMNWCKAEIERLRKQDIERQEAILEDQETIENLRQRVKELEDQLEDWKINATHRDRCLTSCEGELAELCKAQGEPVAWMQSDHLDKFIHHACGSQAMLARCSDHKRMDDFVPLYTSAPSIPEGWQLVPEEPTERMLNAAFHRIESEGVSTTRWLRENVYISMLAVAPKP